MHKGGCCCCSRNAILFKLSLMGMMFALAMFFAGLFYPISAITAPIPLAWAMALLVLLPSITVYYDVKEKFWAEVIAWHEKNKKKSR